MIRFLASVSGPDEALVALGGGVDIIDLKNPSDGALGSLPPSVIEETIAAIGGRRPVSAVAGNLPMEADIVASAIEARLEADFVKIGLLPANRAVSEAVIDAAGKFSERSLLIAVLFADAAPDLDLLPRLADAGFCGVMLDTQAKDGGGLTRHLSRARLQEFVTKAKAHNLMVGLAGSLEAPDVQRLGVLAPDFLGFRGALTTGKRSGTVDEACIRHIASLISGLGGHRRSEREPRETIDTPEIGEPVQGDRIFVRNFVLPLEIGAYAHEYGRRQEVRFSVEAVIDRIPHDARTMADIYSYDVIIDAIRSLAESGHTVLVEELATRLADELVGDRRVHEITVRVEKLGLGPEAVGVEIVRST